MAASEQSRKFRILLIGGDGGFSGVPRHLQQLLSAVGGMAEFVVLSDRDRGGYGFVSAMGARHVVLPGLATRLSPFVWLRAAFRLAAVIRVEQPDLVWAHSRMGVILLRLLALTGKLESGGPAIATTFHGLPFDKGHRRWAAGMSCMAERRALEAGPSQTLIFLSERARAQFIRAMGAEVCARHVLRVQPNCSNLGIMPAVQPHPGIRRIVMTGRDGWQKNLDRALRIFAELPGNYHLILCGSGTNTDAFRKRARKILGAGPIRRLVFAGSISDIRPQLASADCYLLTSRYEGMPIGALEAFEAGLPVALAEVPGTQTILNSHPFHTALTGAHDVEDPVEDALRVLALTEAFCAERFRRKTMIREAWASRFSFDVWAPAMRDMLSAMLPAEPASRSLIEEATGENSEMAVNLADWQKRRGPESGSPHSPIDRGHTR